MDSIKAYFVPEAPNYSLLALPVMFFLSMAPHWYSVAAVEQIRTADGFPLQSPRVFFMQLAARPVAGDKKSEHTPLERRILLCNACQQNGMENLPVFGLTLLCGIVAQLPGGYMNLLAVIYLVLRTMFNVAYIFTDSKSLAMFRSMIFMGHGLIYFQVFVKSAFAVAGRK